MPAKAVHITDVAVVVVPARSSNVEVTIRNTGANPVDLGASDVAFGSGFTVAAGVEERIPVEAGERLYGRCGAGLATDVDVAY